MCFFLGTVARTSKPVHPSLGGAGGVRFEDGSCWRKQIVALKLLLDLSIGKQCKEDRAADYITNESWH